MTLKFLCAHPDYDLGMIAGLGFQGIRYPIRELADAQKLEKLQGHPSLTPLCIVDSYDLVIPTAEAVARLGRGAIELVNEPDLNGWTPEGWALFTRQAYPAIKVEEIHGIPIPVVSGGISNLNRKQLDFYWAAVHAGLQCDIVGWHRYRTESPPDVPLSDYKTRGQEFKVAAMLGQGKPTWCTETGWHDAHDGSNWSEEDVAGFARREQELQEAAGVPLMCWYQLPDGAGTSYLDHFGIMRVDGSLKPSARVWRSL